MRDRVTPIGCLLAALVGCGPDTAEQAELGEVCGQPSPFRVLELAPDEQLRFEPPLPVGDRVLYLVHKLGEPEGDDIPPTVGTTVWSTGPCGESPIELATGISDLFIAPAWPDVPLGCVEETGDVVTLDPSGARAPHVVFAGIDHTFVCGMRWTDHGVLSVEEHDEARGAVLLHPYPADPYTETSTPIPLLDPVALTPGGRGGANLVGWAIVATEDALFARTPDDDLVRVDLADQTSTTLQTGVGLFDVSRAGNYVLWQRASPSITDEHYVEGDVSLRDVAAGTDAPLATTAINYSLGPMSWADEGVVQLALGNVFGGSSVRLFQLPELGSIDLPAGTYLSSRIDEDRWLAGSMFDARLEVLDPRKQHKTSLLAGMPLHRDADAVHVLEIPKCCIDGSLRDEGPVWRVPYDGSAPERLAARATRYRHRLDDGRIVSAVGIDARMVGALALIEPDTQEELRIDDRVFAFSLDGSRAAEEGILSYSVSDGERSGVYLARLPPRERERKAAVGGSAMIVVDMVLGPDGRPTPQPRGLDEPSARERGARVARPSPQRTKLK